MKPEEHELPRAERKKIYEKRMRSYKWIQIILSALILGAGVLAVRQLMKLDISEATMEAGVRAGQYLVFIMTLAMMQLVFHLGRHIFKTVPWMKEFSQKHENKDIK